MARQHASLVGAFSLACLLGIAERARPVQESTAIEVAENKKQELDDPRPFAGVHTFALSADASLLAYSHTVSQGKEFHEVIVLRNLKTGETKHILRGHRGPVIALAFSTDGKTLLSPCLSRADGQELALDIIRWDVGTGKVAKTDSLEPGGILALSANGKFLVTRPTEEQPIAKVWNLETGKAVSLTGHAKTLGLASISADGTKIATTGDYPTYLIVWDAASGKKLWSHKLDRGKGHTEGGIAFAPDGKTLVVTGHRESLFFDVATGDSTAHITDPGYADRVKFSPDGKLVAFAGGTVKLWSVESKRFVAVLKPSGKPGERIGTGIPFFSADSRTVVTAWTIGQVRIWEVPKLER